MSVGFLPAKKKSITNKNQNHMGSASFEFMIAGGVAFNFCAEIQRR